MNPSSNSHPADPRTLVVHCGGVGDFLLTCPAIAALAHEGPVELVGRPERLALAVAGGIAEEAHDLDRAGFDSLFSTASDRVRAFLKRFSRVVVWMSDDGALAAAIRACGVPDVRIYPGLPPEGYPHHASCYYLECLGKEGGPWRLSVRPATREFDVVMHPGSGSCKKNWPFDRFAAVAAALKTRGRRVTWCFGPAEEANHNLAQGEVLPAMELVDLARHLAAAQCYIGNDSGITHLAAAVGCRTVAVFGPTDPGIWAPQGDHVSVVHDANWADVDTVMRCIDAT